MGNDDIFGRMIVMNSFWSVLFIFSVLLLGHIDMRYGIFFLFIIALFFIIYLDDQVNHNENIEMLE